VYGGRQNLSVNAVRKIWGTYRQEVQTGMRSSMWGRSKGRQRPETKLQTRRSSGIQEEPAWGGKRQEEGSCCAGKVAAVCGRNNANWGRSREGQNQAEEKRRQERRRGLNTHNASPGPETGAERSRHVELRNRVWRAPMHKRAVPASGEGRTVRRGANGNA